MALIAVFSTAVFALCACGPRITNANIDVINKEFDQAEKLKKGGVSPKEVESVLGQPKRIETATLPLETQKKEIDVARYYYEQDGQTIELHFFDNRLISRVPRLEAKSATPTPKE
jgi:hypothetical protein